ncbi:hypothetical protein ON010_g13356 [Phytophthora cinnamomi]|nr:hypothetical protein ON010_g13356 [Phytophthora cinnamomi]
MSKIERFNRTLKMRLLKINQPITEKLLSDVVSGYNNTWHSSIKMTPNQAKGSTIEKDLDHNRELIEKVEGNLPIKSTVLYRLSKGVFDKENARWSNTVYEIVGIDGYRVQIRSKNGHTLYKSPNDIKLFYSKRSDAPFENGQIYEAERLLKHKKMPSGKLKYLVKWKGYDEPTWESQDNLRLINKNRRSKLEQTYFTPGV